MTLDKAECNCKYRIKNINGDHDHRLRLISLGLMPEREIYCYNNQWNGVIVNCYGCQLAMQTDEAALIEIAPMT